MMEIDLIIKMGFFVRDLHNHIAAIHAEQYVGHRHSPMLLMSAITGQKKRFSFQCVPFSALDKLNKLVKITVFGR